MAGEIVASEKQFQEYAEKLGGIANDAASKIIEARDKTSRELVLANERMKKLLSSIKDAERQHAALSSLSDKASILQARLEELEDSLGIDEGRAEELEGLVGKVVRIKSNPGVLMTAAAFAGNGRFMCVWMDGDGYHEIDIPFAVLEVVAPAADKFTDDEVRAAKDQNVPPLDFQRIASPSRFVEQESSQASTEPTIDPILMRPITDLNLTFRSVNCLKAGNIHYIGDLIQISEPGLVANMSRKSVSEIKEALASHGLTLRMKIEDCVRSEFERLKLEARSAMEGGAK